MPDETSSPPLPIAILGTDAVLAAVPATAVQLAHACLAAGYAAVVPASWGDELIAAECLRRVGARGRDPVLCVVCPHVADRLLEAGSDLAPFTVSLVSPPVAAARYLRAMCGEEQVRITFVGACPAGNDESIDEHLAPEGFLAGLAAQGIVISEQPQVFDSVIPPDRRRFQSLPGGVPTADALWHGGGRALIEVDDEDYVADIAQRLVSREHALLDVGPKLGCACSGAVPGTAPRSARVAVAAAEPPRASRPIVDSSVQVDLVRPLPPVHRQRRDLLGGAPLPGRPATTAAAPPPAGDAVRQAPSGDRAGRMPASPRELAGSETATPKRRAIASAVPRSAVGVPTVNSGEGRALPRAYVARRRTGRTPPDNPGIPQHSAEAPPSLPAQPAPTVVGAPGSVPARHAAVSLHGRRAARRLQEFTRSAVDHTRERPMVLAALIGLMALVFVLLGLAAGWWITGVGEQGIPSAGQITNEAPQRGAQTLLGPPDDSISRTVERAGSVGPELPPPRSSPPSPAAEPTRRTSVPAAARPIRQPVSNRASEVRTGGRAAAAAPEPPVEGPPLPAARAIAPSESSGVRQAPVLPPVAAPSRRDSIDRELQAIARELQLRRARIDSIARNAPLPTRPQS